MDELELKREVPYDFNALSSTIVQNSMINTDEELFVSNHGDIDKAWMSIGPGATITFSGQLFFMQKSFNQYVFPVVTI